MAKRRSRSTSGPAAVNWKAGCLKGRTVCFTGKLQQITKKRAVEIVKAEGGHVAEKLAADVDVLVVGVTSGKGPSRVVTQAEKLNREAGAAIEFVDEAGLRELLIPGREALVAMLRAGKAGITRWNKVVGRLWPDATIDLGGADFRGCSLAGVDFSNINVDGCDFRDAVFADVTFGRVEGARFDGCRGYVTIQDAHNCSFRKANFDRHTDRRCSRLSAVSSNMDGCRLSDVIASSLAGCSLKRADMSEVSFDQGNLAGADLTGANLRETMSGYIRAVEASFEGTDCTRADLRCSIFDRSSFHRANLTDAVLHNASFEEADLRGARLKNADLRWAGLQNADLTGADLSGALLEDADFTGAKLDGAKLKGADLSNARLSESQLASTSGQVKKAPGTMAAGTRVRELEEIALRCRELTVSINVAAGKKKARLVVEASSLWGGSVTGREDRLDKEWEPTTFAGEETFSGCLLWLRNRWPKGQLDLASLEVVAKRSPLRKKPLRFLAAAAWQEAFGLPPLTEDEFRRLDSTVSSAAGSLRDTMIAELQGGPEGIRKWNARSYEERVNPGEFRRVDFSGRKMTRVNLEGVDLQKANFTGATLNYADMYCRDLKHTVFDGIAARGASFHATKLAGASFRGAKLPHAHFRLSSMLRVCFQDADLRRADFMSANIRGADFTGADLTGAEFDRTKFDEETVFPAGFQLPDSLVWKGTGSDPRNAG